jgi:dGTPase
VVDHLEERYPAYNGLNLTFETREGILKHCSARNAQLLEAAEPGGVARRFIDRTQPSLEAQLCNLADAIAYNAHDIDDGVRSGLISMAQLQSVPLFEDHRQAALSEHPDLAEPKQARRLLYETIRRMLSAQVYDVIAATSQGLQAAAPADAEAARLCAPLVRFSPAMHARSTALKQFLFAQLYRHPQVMQTMGHASVVVQELFEAYSTQPSEMPADFAARADTFRAVADYIAGMTDRFAAKEHERLTGRRLL